MIKKYFLIIMIVLAANIVAEAQTNSKKEYKTSKIKDLALIYQGGVQRIDWTQDQFVPYVTHTFANGEKDWLFDGFLFLEFTDGKGYSYAYGYSDKKARKVEWEWLLNRLFEREKSLDALDKCIDSQKRELGAPKFKHKIVLGLTIPLPKQTDWGVLNGDTLNFNNTDDQLKAVKWYIDELTSRFAAAKYRNIELSGFYWVDEDMATSRNLPKPVSEYIHSLNKEFVWIPYWKAKGYESWRELGFDITYMQPNHFFDKHIPDSRLDDACKVVLDNGMAMEFECDSKALYNDSITSYDRMLSYINKFKEYDVFSTSAIAYYTGSKGILDMYNSKRSEDKVIMDLLARYIIKRRSIKALDK